MDAIECINARYSCRDFDPRPVPREWLELLVDAGRRAPSGRREEPLEFIVVTGQADRDFFARVTTAGKFIADAAACIVVLSHPVANYVEDGSAAVQNILLAATALELGSCWVAGDKRTYADDVLRHCQAPPGCRLVALVAVGHPRTPGRQPPHRPLEQVLHWERFQRGS